MTQRARESICHFLTNRKSPFLLANKESEEDYEFGRVLTKLERAFLSRVLT